MLYIIRIINGIRHNFVPVCMIDTQLFSIHSKYLSADVFSCASVKSHYITESEAELLNEISLKYSDQINMNHKYVTGEDRIVTLEDVQQLYIFIRVCFDTLIGVLNPILKKKCGYICIESELVIPYFIKDGKKYVLSFSLEKEFTENEPQVIKLENWDLAYLKFCCKIAGFQNELFEDDSCIALNLEELKKHLEPSTNIEDLWPTAMADRNLLVINQSSVHVSSLGSWIRTPSTLTLNKSEDVQHSPSPSYTANDCSTTSMQMGNN